MKSLLLISILLVILCHDAFGMVTGGMFRDPKNPGMCTINSNMIIKNGDVLKNPNGECAEWTCYDNGHAMKTTCHKQGMREGCTEGKVLLPYAAYPGCCKREIKCLSGYYSE